MSVNPRLPLLRVPSKKQKKRPITHPRFSFPYFPLPNHHRESSLSLGIVAGGGGGLFISYLLKLCCAASSFTFTSSLVGRYLSGTPCIACVCMCVCFVSIWLLI